MTWSGSGQVTDYRSTAASTKTARECKRPYTCVLVVEASDVPGCINTDTAHVAMPSDTSTVQVQKWCTKETPRRFWPVSACRMITDKVKTAGRDFSLPCIEVFSLSLAGLQIHSAWPPSIKARSSRTTGAEKLGLVVSSLAGCPRPNAIRRGERNIITFAPRVSPLVQQS